MRAQWHSGLAEGRRSRAGQPGKAAVQATARMARDEGTRSSVKGV